MNREAPVAYDYESKGAADFKAGRKDERLYANAENHGASYRRGWQNARRQADAGQDTRPAPFHVEPKEPPPQPKPASVTVEQVRLQIGEDKPKKPKPADPEQLAFF